MKDIFPIEIVEYSNEKYWIRRSVRSRIIYAFVISVLLIVVILLPVINVDISSQSRGNIRSVFENNTLQSVVSAEISYCNIRENQFVKQGDTLILLESNVLDEQMKRLEEKLSENLSFIMDIDNLLMGKVSSVNTPKYRAEYAQYYSKLNEQEIAKSKAEYEYKVSSELYNKGVESQFDHNQVSLQYDIANSQLSLIKQDYSSSWHTERTRLEFENRDLNSELKRLEKQREQYYITAPISGNIVQYTGAKEGSFINAGQAIAQITSDDDLIVECYVSSSDIGYVYVGQEISFQMDAFDYRQWGLLHGKVLEIISDVVTVNNSTYFRVRCSMDKDYLQLKNGYKGYLKKGMTLTGRFYLTKRSLAQLLFDKIDNWVNPKIVN